MTRLRNNSKIVQDFDEKSHTMTAQDTISKDICITANRSGLNLEFSLEIIGCPSNCRTLVAVGFVNLGTNREGYFGGRGEGISRMDVCRHDIGNDCC